MPIRPDKKVCKKCLKEQHISMFGNLRVTKDGYKNYCKKCCSDIEKDRAKTKTGLISQIWNNKLKRTETKKLPKIAYTQEEFTLWCLEQSIFHTLYDNWVASGYLKELVPSIDRKNDYLGYSFDNIEITTWNANNKKGYETRKNGENTKGCRGVNQLTLSRELIKEFPSIAVASRTTGIDRANIQKCCVGSAKSAGNFIWEYAEITLDDIEEFSELVQKGNSQIRSNGVVVRNPSSKEVWKLFERNVARDFGTTRTPLSGMVKTITNSDTLHPKIYVECKLRAKDFNFWEEFEELRKAKKGICGLTIAKGDSEILLIHHTQFLELMSSPKFDLNLISEKILSKKHTSVLSLFQQTEERAEIEGKLPVVALKKKNKSGYLIGTHPRNLVELHKILNKVNNE